MTDSPAFKRFRQNLDILEIARKLGDTIVKSGSQNMILCPFHTERSPSCSLTNKEGGVYHCFGCGAGGDALNFYMERTGVGFRDALHDLGGSDLPEAQGGRPNAPKRSLPAAQRVVPAVRAEPELPAFTVITPAPADAPDLMKAWAITGRFDVWNPSEDPEKHGRLTMRPTRLYVYSGAGGAIHNYQTRRDWIDQETKKSKKAFTPLTWTAEHGWTMTAPRDRVPYNFRSLLEAQLSIPVLIVEGEKAADSLIKIAGELNVVVLSWLSGSKSVAKTNWAALQSRRVILWPDADQPGRSCMEQLGEIALKHGAASVRTLKPPRGKAEGWDAADAIEEDKWTIDGLRAFIDGLEFTKGDDDDLDEPASAAPQTVPVNPVKSRPSAALEMAPRIRLTGPTADSTDTDTDNAGDEQADDQASDISPLGLFDPDGDSEESEFSREARQYWSPLGYSVSAEGQMILHFLLNVENREGVYLPFRGRALKDYALIDLAPLAFWQRHFGDPEDAKVDWLSAADAIQTEQRQMPPFDPARLRGSGAWLDDGQIVINQGKHLLVDGEVLPIEARRNGPIYMRSRDLPPPSDKPLSAREGEEIINLLMSLRWEDSLQSLLLAGWVMLAQICGALSWRPHIWLRGGPGSGKSTLLNEIVSPLLPHNILVTGPTTEAGLRQNLKSDARPVLFDEAEGLDDQSRRRIQGVIELARIASREMEGATIMKGTSSQSGQSFKIRTMFLFSAIGTSMQQQADIDRITVLSLLPRIEDASAAKQWDDIKRNINKVIRPDTGVRLLARAIKLAPTLFEQQKRFAAAAAEKVGSMRLGEQLGILLMGSWFLAGDEPPTDVELASLVAVLADRFEDQKSSENSNSVRILAQICAHGVRVDMPERVSISIPLGTLIQICFGQSDGKSQIGVNQATRALREHGLLPLIDAVAISNTHPRLKEILKDSPFEVNWRVHLKDLDGAVVPPAPLTFTEGQPKARGIVVPLRHFSD